MDDDPEDGDILDEIVDGGDDDAVFEEARFDSVLENSNHNILQAAIDPIEWKTELERVGPKLRSNQVVASNEWRSHVDQTVTSKTQIEKVLTDTEGDIKLMCK